LSAAGLTKADVEFLVDQGCADVKSGEVRHSAGLGRSRKYDPLSEQTYFFLTPTGEAVIERFLHAFGEFRSRVDKPPWRPGSRPHKILKPHWDRQRRELRFGPVVLKQFRKTSPNQERLLAAFEESGWPEGIEDPLPPIGRGSPVPRLHDTLRRLNDTLQQPLIRFDRDPAGQRVTWRYVGSADATSPVDGFGWGLLIG
jgi:hypothetical protein